METIQAISGRRLPAAKDATVAGARTQPNEKNLEKLASACKEMESLFVQEMLKSMRRAVPKTALFHGGRAEEIYTGLYDQQISREVVESDGVGVHRVLYEQLKGLLPESK